MAKEMTPRERWLAILNRQQPDRVPTDYWATGEFHAKLKTATGCTDDESLWRKLGIDRPRGVGPAWKLKHHPDDPQGDQWGIRYQSIDYGTGSYGEASHHPLAHWDSRAQVNAFRWPSPDDFDFDSVSQTLLKDDGYRIIQGGHYEPFLLYCNLRGMEQAYEDLLVNPELAEAILDRIFWFFYEINRKTWEAGKGKIDIMYLAEDLGGQSSPLFSMEVYRKFIRPNQQRMAELAHSFGIKVFYHTDGAARPFLNDLIDVVGIDMLNPLQWRCPGMDLKSLVRDFGSRIAFHGGIDNQQTLPFGSVADVEAEVRQVAALMESARWICAPCHNLQAVSPPENVIALYRTIHGSTTK